MLIYVELLESNTNDGKYGYIEIPEDAGMACDDFADGQARQGF